MANEVVKVTEVVNTISASVNDGSYNLLAGGTIGGALQLNSTLTVGVDDTGYDVKFFGDTIGKYLQWDASADKLILSGDFDVTGTTTTFNSTVVKISDPIFTLGGTDPPDSDDNKDRGIEFHYHDGSSARVGFFGYDDSASAFTFLTAASNSSEVFSGTAGNIVAGDLTTLDINLTDPDVAHGVTNVAATNVFGNLTTIHGTQGGLYINGISDQESASARSLALRGICNDTHTDSVPTVEIIGAKRSGTTIQALAAAETVLTIANHTTDLLTVLGSGNTGIGTATPAEKLDVAGVIKLSGGYVLDSAHSLRLDSASGQPVTISANDAEIARFDSTGLGIGCTPSADLHILKNSSNGQAYERLIIDGDTQSTTASGSSQAITFRGTADTYAGAIGSYGDGTVGGIGIWGGSTNSGTPDVFVKDGASTFSGAVTVGVNDTGHDVKFFGATAGSYLEWDESADKLILTESSLQVIAGTPNIQLYDSSSTGTFDITLDGVNTTLKNGGTDGDLIFQSDNGSGGEETYFYLDGSLSGGNPYTIFPDSSNLCFGTGSDLTISHDGTNNYINASNGDLIIKQLANDKDILFQCDDGSGGTETYFFLDGSAGPRTIFPDGSLLNFGTGNDLSILHDGNNSYIWANGTGNFYIDQLTDDADIIFRCDDGSGGEAAYITLDGSSSHTLFSKPILMSTGQQIYFMNTTTGMNLSHDGSNAYLINGTGDLTFSQGADDKDIIFKCDNGSGGTEIYFYLDGSASSGNPVTNFPDNSALTFGNDRDYWIYHDGTDSRISNYVGDLVLRNYADDKDISFVSDDGSGNTTEYFRLDGSLGYSVASKPIRFEDDIAVYFGTGGDLQLWHDGSNSTILNYTGHLTIKNVSDDSDIVFQCDDGSGGYETYFYLDGSLSSGYPYTIFPDNSRLAIGTGADLYFKHDGSNSWVYNTTGHLTIQNQANDSDIIFQSDDGSGGTTEYFRVDGGVGNITFTKELRILDGVQIQLGTGNDMRVHHNGATGYIQNSTGDFRIEQALDDGDMEFYCDDGSGGLTKYFHLDGGDEVAKFSKPLHVGYDDVGHDVKFFGATAGRYMIWDEDQDALKLSDGVALRCGSGNDLYIKHDGSNSYIDHAGTGDLYIQNNKDDKDIVFQSDDGNGGVATYFSLDGGAATYSGATTALYTIFPDKSRIALGTGKDLMIFHDGSNSYIQESGDGDLIVNASTFRLRAANNASTMITGFEGAAVSLYNNNSVRLETTAGGVTITGAISLGVATPNNTDYTVLNTDYCIIMHSLSQARTIDIPTAQRTVGRILVIKTSSNAAMYNVVIDPQDSVTIDGATTYTISTDKGSVTLISDGSNWFVI